MRRKTWWAIAGLLVGLQVPSTRGAERPFQGLTLNGDTPTEPALALAAQPVEAVAGLSLTLPSEAWSEFSPGSPLEQVSPLIFSAYQPVAFRPLVEPKPEGPDPLLDAFSGLIEAIDYRFDDRAAFLSDYTYFFLPVTLPLGAPARAYIDLAREYADYADMGRNGLGVGVRWFLAPQMDLGLETIYFPSNQGISNFDAFSRAQETLGLVRWEWKF